MPAPKSFVPPSQCSVVLPPSTGGRPGPKNSLRASTFPTRFEPLRNQLFEQAKQTPDFLDTVFTMHEAPTDDEIMQAVENRLFSLLHRYPHWFGLTKSVDASARTKQRRYQIEHGLIEAEEQPAHFAVYRKRLAAISAGEIEEEGLW